MSHWLRLLDRAMRGLGSFEQLRITIEDWTLGGGTALMLQHQHRLSKDIDIFIGDAQYLSYLSPRLGGESIWNADAYDEAAHYLKLRYREGEIDFIVSDTITVLSPLEFETESEIQSSIPPYRFFIEHPVEIALKKLWYRSADLKIRDIFDIVVVAEYHESLLLSNLHHVRSRKAAILSRLDAIDPNFFLMSIEELDILPNYTDLAGSALSRARSILSEI